MTNELPLIDPAIDPTTDSTNNESRRAFLKKFGASFAGVTIIGSLPAFLEACSNATSTAADDGGKTMTVDVSTLTADDMAVAATSPGGNPLLIIRLSATNYETLVMICKHEGCKPPNMALSGASINCSCHGSIYDINGKVTRGPARASLDKVTTTFDDTSKKVTLTF